MTKNKWSWMFGIILFAVTIGLYWQTRNFDYINYDDRVYIHRNGVVTNGLTVASIRWAFSAEPCRQTSNWHPITTLSWMLDITLFGDNAGAMHLHNACIHAIDAVLVFIFLLIVCCLVWPDKQESDKKIRVDATTPRQSGDSYLLFLFAAFIGAAFWAWHPLRAESVAWVSSRKDVLSILFLLPGLMAYLKRLQGGGKIWLFVSGTCYLLAYFSKPTAVVYPILAVLLEYVVTRRISWRQNELLVYIMGVLMAVTFMVQDMGGAPVEGLSVWLRLENAVAGVGRYVMATIWPTDLCVFHNYVTPVPLLRFIVGATFILVVVCYLADKILPKVKANWSDQKKMQERGDCPVEPCMMYAVGLLWFGISLGPVAGLIQVGFAASADRYTYLSGIGLSLVITVSIARLYIAIQHAQIKYRQYLNIGLGLLFCGGVLIMSSLAWKNISHWKNLKTVFSQAINATDENYIAYCNVGICLLDEGKMEEAFENFLLAAKYFFINVERKGVIPPYQSVIQSNLSVAFSGVMGKKLRKVEDGFVSDEDDWFISKISHQEPLAAKKIFAQGLCAYWRELDSLAVNYFDEALQLTQNDPAIWRFKGYCFVRLEQYDAALDAFKRCYALNPERDIKERIKKLEQMQRPR